MGAPGPTWMCGDGAGRRAGSRRLPSYTTIEGAVWTELRGRYRGENSADHAADRRSARGPVFVARPSSWPFLPRFDARRRGGGGAVRGKVGGRVGQRRRRLPLAHGAGRPGGRPPAGDPPAPSAISIGDRRGRTPSATTPPEGRGRAAAAPSKPRRRRRSEPPARAAPGGRVSSGRGGGRRAPIAPDRRRRRQQPKSTLLCRTSMTGPAPPSAAVGNSLGRRCSRSFGPVGRGRSDRR